MNATTVLRTPTFRPPPARLTTHNAKCPKPLSLSFTQRQTCPNHCRIWRSSHSTRKPSRRLLKFLSLASYGETTETETEIGTETQEKESEVLESELQDNSDGAVDMEETASEGDSTDVEEPSSAIIASLQLYKEALASNDKSRVAEIEAFLKSVEHERTNLERKVSTLSEELSYEKDRILRISADFDNFRKRTERERLSLVTNAQGEVIENLLSVLDNFERAKEQIKVDTEGEEKINDSYQSIYKQFVEILSSIGVVPVETIGNPFDPLLHEAIMREDSAQFEEDIIIQEFRKGFKLGDRLLRPSMVKVSAGPGPVNDKSVAQSEEPEGASESDEKGNTASPEH